MFCYSSDTCASHTPNRLLCSKRSSWNTRANILSLAPSARLVSILREDQVCYSVLPCPLIVSSGGANVIRGRNGEMRQREGGGGGRFDSLRPSTIFGTCHVLMPARFRQNPTYRQLVSQVEVFCGT